MKKLITIFVILVFACAAFGMVVLPSRHWSHYTHSQGANCKLLIHSNTTDGSTTFTDSGPNNHTITAGNSVQHDTAQQKFGTTSILFTQASEDYLTVADHADWNFGSGNFTIDFWIRFASFPAAITIWDQLEIGVGRFVLSYTDGTSTVQMQINDGVATDTLNWDWNASINIWYHVALIRGWGGGANTFAVTVNGSALNLASGSTTRSVIDIGDDPSIGALVQAGPAVTFEHDGWKDAFRVTKGVAIWTAPFMPPIRQYK